MRQQTEVSERGYDGAAGTDAYQWLAYGRPQGSGPYQVPLRDRASRQWQAPEPQFRPAAIPGQRPGATPPSLAPLPSAASRRASDSRLALTVALVFLGLFCLVGAWWLHTASAARHAPPAGTSVVAPTGQ